MSAEALKKAMDHMADVAQAVKDQLAKNDRRARSTSPSASRADNIKVDKFESDDPFQWDIWKKAFVFAAKNNGWDNRRARRFLAGSMKGTAAQLVDHIEVEDDAVQVADWKLLLEKYEEAFRPQAASDLAAWNYEAATQMPEEKIGNWHARIRKLYLLAKNVKEVTNDPQLNKAFLRGLWDNDLRHDLLKEKPKDYSDLLAKANDVQAVLRQRADYQAWQTTAYAANVAREKNGGSVGAIARKEVGAITKNTVFHYSEGQLKASPPIDGPNAIRCYACEGPHMKRDCPSLKIADDYRRKMEARKKSASNNRPSRAPPAKRNSGKGGKPANGKRARGVNSITTTEEHHSEDEEELDQGNESGREEPSKILTSNMNGLLRMRCGKFCHIKNSPQNEFYEKNRNKYFLSKEGINF